MAGAEVYRELGESAWSWVRASVRDDEGPWLPTSVDGATHLPTSQADRATIYFGTGGLALVLAEVQLARALHDDEAQLAEAIRTNVAGSSMTRRAACLYWGLAGDATVLRVLGAVEEALRCSGGSRRSAGRRGGMTPSLSTGDASL